MRILYILGALNFVCAAVNVLFWPNLINVGASAFCLIAGGVDLLLARAEHP